MKKNKKLDQKVSFFDILNLFKAHPTRIFTIQEIAGSLGIETNGNTGSLMLVLDRMTEDHVLDETEKGSYRLRTKQRQLPEGIIEITQSGIGFVTLKDSTTQKDVYVQAGQTQNALTGDKVRVELHKKKPGSRPEGKVTEILERARTRFVGSLKQHHGDWFLIPDNARIPFDFRIKKDALIKQVKEGIKAQVEVVNWNDDGGFPLAVVIKVLGEPGLHSTEMHAIIAEYGFTEEFPQEVIRQSEEIPSVISSDEIKKRRDFRPISTFTIDPADAKDFDDALSVDIQQNGDVEVGIHIADVTHYVIPTTELDAEAYRRATSVYLVDRTIPMLPERLSNGLCSLRPKEDKLCFSAVFVLTKNAEIKSEWYGRTIIHSDRRFTYEEAQEIIETGRGDFANELALLHQLSKTMRKQRSRKGAISFEKKEVKFRLDNSGKPTGVIIKEAKDSNKLIEDFMLLANRKVAETVGLGIREQKPSANGKAFVYRIHDKPNDEKMFQFSKFMKKLGYKLSTGQASETSQSLNKLLGEVKGKKESNLVEQLAVRAMAKAIYSVNNIGHYGLAFEHYTHFTSPIRRYPDMMVHRLLQLYLDHHHHKTSKGNHNEKWPDIASLTQWCKHSSDMEKQASDAERASIKYKQVEFMMDKTGIPFKAVISGFNEYGMFAEIEENLCEGMIRFREISFDYLVYDENNYCATGKRSKKTYRLGDEIIVEVKKADLNKKQLDFTLIHQNEYKGLS